MVGEGCIHLLTHEVLQAAVERWRGVIRQQHILYPHISRVWRSKFNMPVGLFLLRSLSTSCG